MSSTCAVACPLVGVRAPATAARGRSASTTSPSPSLLKCKKAMTMTRRGIRSGLRVAAGATDVMDKLDAEGQAAWESCKMMVMDLGMDEEAAEKCLVKAFGW